MNTKKRVAITGVGPLCSIGVGKEAVWKGLIEGKTGVILEKNYIENNCVGTFYKHKIQNFNINNFNLDDCLIDEIKDWQKGIEVLDLYFLIAAIKLASDDSKINYKKDGSKISLVIAHENPGLETFCTNLIKGIVKQNSSRKSQNFCEAFDNFYLHNNRSAYELQSFMFLFHIYKTLGIHGYSLIINNACASGLYAIEAASNIIKAGRSEIVIVGASDNPGVYKNLWLKEAGLYAEDGKVKPFAKDRNGFVCGDGGVALVLEDLSRAKRRKAHIYAEYLGGGFFLEGWKVTLPAITKHYYRDAILQALSFSNTKINEVDLINAHGVGTNLIDSYEAKSITDIFGKNFKKPLLTAFKPFIGHNLGGSALLETAILLLSLEKDIVLPVLNCKEIDPKLNINLVLEKIPRRIETVLKLCCGFGGYDGAVLFRKLK